MFTTSEYINIPLNSFSWLQSQKRILLFAFVIMPSHLHAILKPENLTIGEVVQQFGSYTAHEILKKLRSQNQQSLLDFFQRQKRDQRHEHSIWQDIQAKNIYSLKVLEQKLECIHRNPVTKGWNLAVDRTDYPYSTAGYYDHGRKPLIEVTDINVWLATTPSPETAKGAERK